MEKLIWSLRNALDNKVSHPFMQPQDVNFHGQEQVYGDLGEEMLEHAFEGKSNEQKKLVRMTSKKYFSNIVKVLLLLRFSWQKRG